MVIACGGVVVLVVLVLVLLNMLIIRHGGGIGKRGEGRIFATFGALEANEQQPQDRDVHHAFRL